MFLKRLWPALLWALFILVVTGTPGEYFPHVVTFWDWLEPDKIVHIFVFGVLSFLILQGLLPQYLESRHRYKIVAATLGFVLAYGLLTEVLQAYVFIGRDGNAFDFYADSIGAFAGWMGFWTLNRKKIKIYSDTNQD
jgi:VanZ family protein